MTSTTQPPAPVEAGPAAASSPDDEHPVRRFGTARALGLALAAFVGGYLALLALGSWVDIVREDLWSNYDPFGGQAAVGRFRLLLLGAVSLGALAGFLAVIGLAVRRLAVLVLVVTITSLLCHVGFALQIVDTTFRGGFLEPGRAWSPSFGLPFTVAVLALQVLVVLLCLVRGPRPAPVVVAPPVVHSDDTPPPVTHDHDHDERSGDLATAETDHEEDRDVVATEVADGEDTGEGADDVFLVIHGQEYGPYPTDRVRGFMVEGRIHPGTLVRIGDETKPASEVPAIYGS